MKNWFFTTLVIGALACPVAHAAQKSERMRDTMVQQQSEQREERTVRHGRHHARHHHKHHGHKQHSGCCESSYCQRSYYPSACCVTSRCGCDCAQQGHKQHHGKYKHHKHASRHHDRAARQSRRSAYGYSYASNPQDEVDTPEKTNR